MRSILLIQKNFESFLAAENFKKVKKTLKINGKSIHVIDSAGALILQECIEKIKIHHPNICEIILEKLSHKQEKLIQLVVKAQKENKFQVRPVCHKPPFLEKLGRLCVKKILEIVEFLNFIGMVSVEVLKSFSEKRKIPPRAIISTIEIAGVYAIPLVALLSFLIGMVLAYQMGMQLKNYGANIYIADLMGLSLLREFSPLMTAIIFAGRSGSAFTAQLGTMKIGEEIDALTTMGLSPVRLLIIPRVIGLMIALPLLTILSSILGTVGGMFIAKTVFNIPYNDFLHRFNEAISVKHFLIGMIKTPIFGFMIAAIGCFQGIQVMGSASSVGEKTTKSVVQAIFIVIVIDALFSVLFSKLGL